MSPLADAHSGTRVRHASEPRQAVSLIRADALDGHRELIGQPVLVVIDGLEPRIFFGVYEESGGVRIGLTLGGIPRARAVAAVMVERMPAFMGKYPPGLVQGQPESNDDHSSRWKEVAQQFGVIVDRSEVHACAKVPSMVDQVAQHFSP